MASTPRPVKWSTHVRSAQEIPCPWCAFTDVRLKKVLNHMESAHYQQWCDLALSSLVAGDGPV